MAKLSAKTFTFGKFKGQAMGGANLIGTVEGTEELAAKLRELDKKARNDASKAGIQAAGTVIAQEWSERAPELDSNYRRSIAPGKIRSTKNGASGIVHPEVLEDLEDDQQPWAYAARLEYGDASRAAEPSARPAFDASAGRATDAAAEKMAAVVMEVAK